MPKTLLAFLLMFATVPIHATVHIWTGATSHLFSDASNWRGGSPAGDPAAELAFPPGATRTTITNDVPGLTIRSLSIMGPGYTIGGLPLTLASDAAVTDASPGPNTIECDVHLAGGATFRNNHNVYDGGLILSGAISGSGPIVKHGYGRLTFSGTSPNTYSGATHVLDGELRLHKSAGVDAIRGDLVIGTANYEEDGIVTTIASEQIADAATIRVRTTGDLAIGAIETIGPLELEGGADIETAISVEGWTTYIGTVILAGDVQILPGPDSVTLYGDIALAGTRTFTSCETCLLTELNDLRDHTPGSGLILRGGKFGIRDSRYLGPTLIDEADAVIFNPETTVRLRGGSFAGEVHSLIAEHGTLDARDHHAVFGGDLILNASTTVRLDFPPRTTIEVGGMLNLGGARLAFDESLGGRTLGRTHDIVLNAGTDAIRGTFAGAPEGAVLHQRFRVTYAGNDGNDIVVTEVGRYSTSISLDASPDDAASGDTVTLTAKVHANFGRANAGTVTFREGDTVLGTAAVSASGIASITLQPSWGFHTYRATYEGTDIYAGSEESEDVAVRPPTPVITSIEPSTFTGGTTATAIVRGTDFVPGGELRIHANGVNFTYVSSSEIHFEWEVPRHDDERTWTVRYRQPQPGYVESNEFPIVVNAGVPLTPPFTFEPRAIVAPVVPGGDVAWMSLAVRFANQSNRLERRTAITSDTDRDGLTRWELTDDIPSYGLWLTTDMTDGRIAAGRRSGLAPEASPMPAAMFLRDEQGHYAHLVMKQELYPTYILWDVLWVRPGVGAWTASLSDGGEGDLDGLKNGYAVHHVSQMRAVGNSPAPPAGFERGDLLAGIDWSMQRWFGDRVDVHLHETDGAGTLRLFHTYRQQEGTVPAARFVVMRPDGSDGTVSVKYTTVNETAIAGVHYEARAGTLTFGPGELVKAVDIPLIDDQVFSGETRFQVVLSQPAGTTITGNATGTIELDDDDPAPHLFAADMTVVEGDHGTGAVQFAVHVSGEATRVPITATWHYKLPPYYDWFGGEPLTFLPGGPSTQTITIPYEANLTPEDDRRILVMIDISDGVSRSYIDRTITIVDDDLAALTILDATVSESREEVTVVLGMATPSEKTVTVQYATANGSATAGTDFTATTGSVTLHTSRDEATISIPLVRDNDAEGDEWFSLVLSDPIGATLRRGSATVIILDDDSNAIPAITATSPIAIEGADVTFNFRLTFPVLHEVRVRAATQPGTATNDFIAIERIVVIAPGDTEAHVTVRLRDDAIVEPTETFSLVLSKPVGATIATPTATATILDDDSAPDAGPTLAIDSVIVVEGAPALFTVRLGQTSTSTVTVPYATTDTSAVAPGDYAAASGKLTFAPGERVKMIEIATIDDALYELDERFRLVVGGIAASGTITNNDPVPPPRGRAARH